MAGGHAGRRVTCVLAALGSLWIAVPPAEGLEAFDGRIQAHGFLEMQIRGLDRDFEEELDLAQWYNVVNVELEFDILPDGWGPFNLFQAYVRVEGRFDCVYYDTCGIFPGARTYGNKSRNLPLRLRDAIDEDYAGVIESNDQADPPGLVPRVPEAGDKGRNPTGWVESRLRTLPVVEPWDTSYVPGEDYDPLLDNSEAPFNPTPSPPPPEPPTPQYAPWIPDPRPNTPYCPTNGLTGTLAAPIGCYTNRPTVFEIEKRIGFPGFDTVFDIQGADGELGPYPDYHSPDPRLDPSLPVPLAGVPDLGLSQPEASVNDLREVLDALRAGGAPDSTVGEVGELGAEWLLRGLALERDDPAYYTFAVKVDTSIINAVDVSAIPAGELTQERAEAIVYGVMPPLEADPSKPDKLEGVGGLAEKIRDAGQLYTLDSLFDWKLTFRKKAGPGGGTGRTMILGPWLPKNFFGSLAAASDRANPFRGRKTPTNIFFQPGVPAEEATPRRAGQRYHILDVASGYFDPTDADNDPTTGCDTGPCTYGADPVDPRVLKYEQLLIAADIQHYSTTAGPIFIGGKDPRNYAPLGNRAYFGPYPNRYLSGVFATGAFNLSFGGDFSGIVPRYNTYTNRPEFGAPLKETPFIQQVGVPGTPEYNPSATETTIAYTNVRVTGGLGELPMRVAPDRSNLSRLNLLEAQGLYIPSAGLVDALQTVDFDDHEFNISQIDRAFNHGASQSDTYELKEAYLDMEFLDSRLWLRAGIQNIVWGKTELFRTTDQFNPQDLAMASLPGLEESRIALLSARAVYSFYDVGPLEDVRLELAANFDRIKPADLGACGEPYTIDVVCMATFGLAIHSLAGFGLAGVDRPPSAWNDVKGVEFGGRIEFRWDRFSFAITDFYGYNDLPYPDPIFFYERNVDPNTGRPRKANATGPCENAAGFRVVDGNQSILHAGNSRREFIEGDLSARPTGEGTPGAVWDDYARRAEAYGPPGVGIDEACLKPGGAPGGPNENRFDPSKAQADPDDYPGLYWSSGAGTNSYIYQTLNQWSLPGSSVDYALAYHPANQQFFAALCSTTITVAVSLSPGSCAWNIFGTPAKFISIESPGLDLPPFSEYFSAMVAGEIDKNLQDDNGWRLIIQNTKAGREARGFIPTAPMNRDVRDGLVTATSGIIRKGTTPTDPANFLTFDSTLTSEQKALLGCGPFFGIRCDSGAERLLGPYTLYGDGGGIDMLNAEASAVLLSFPGIEGTESDRVTPREVRAGEDLDYDESGTPPFPDPRKNSERELVWVDVWTTWSDDPQPGTVDFEGMEYCTRYAPDSPYADERGIVRLPGCRGVERVTVNHEPNFPLGPYLFPTIEVLFEEHYTPRQDGCIFGSTMTSRDGTTVYLVKAVNEDGTLNGALNTELAQTCFNTTTEVSKRSTHRWTGAFDPNVISTWPYVGQTQSVLGARTLFHPLGSCESAGLDISGEYPTWIGDRDYGFLCDFRLRNYEADFIEGHAQVFQSEIANWSWNFLMFLAVTSCNSASGGDDLTDPDCFDPELAWDVTRCSLSTPQFCRNVKSFLAIGATNRNHVRAGGNDRFGRRDFIWQSGGEAVLSYARRNVFGFSMDFAEDVSKTNWGLEFTWFGDMPFVNNNSWYAISDSQMLNLTISVDRPTFINFLNANRTFFFNTQWFFQYLLDYDKGFSGTTGPFNVLFTFAFFTGYFQDRLLPQMVTVYDFRSQSGGFLPSIQYRFNERFSVTFGINYWIGRGQYVPMPLRGLGPVTNRAGKHAYEDGTEFLISNFRHRDEAYLRIRWTF